MINFKMAYLIILNLACKVTEQMSKTDYNYLSDLFGMCKVRVTKVVLLVEQVSAPTKEDFQNEFSIISTQRSFTVSAR